MARLEEKQERTCTKGVLELSEQLRSSLLSTVNPTHQDEKETECFLDVAESRRCVNPVQKEVKQWERKGSWKGSKRVSCSQIGGADMICMVKGISEMKEVVSPSQRCVMPLLMKNNSEENLEIEDYFREKIWKKIQGESGKESKSTWGENSKAPKTQKLEEYSFGYHGEKLVLRKSSPQLTPGTTLRLLSHTKSKNELPPPYRSSLLQINPQKIRKIAQRPSQQLIQDLNNNTLYHNLLKTSLHHYNEDDHRAKLQQQLSRVKSNNNSISMLPTKKSLQFL